MRFMKKLVFLILTFVWLNQSTLISQSFSASSTFSIGSYNKFNNSIGYELTYSIPIKSKSRFGLSFAQSFTVFDYEYTFFSDAYGQEYYRDVKPKNQRLTFSVDFAVDVLHKEKSSFYLGSRLGLNYFNINEIVSERRANENDEHDYTNKYSEINKIGIGLILEYERKVFSEKISFFATTQPELIFYSKFWVVGSSDPYLIGMIDFKIGMRFKIENKP